MHLCGNGVGGGLRGGQSSYSLGNTPYKIKMGVIVAVVLFGNLQKIASQKNIGTILMLLNGLTFGTSTISFIREIPTNLRIVLFMYNVQGRSPCCWIVEPGWGDMPLCS